MRLIFFAICLPPPIIANIKNNSLEIFNGMIHTIRHAITYHGAKGPGSYEGFIMIFFRVLSNV